MGGILSNIFSLDTLLKIFTAAGGIGIITGLLGFLLPNKMVIGAGRTVGRIASAFFRQRMGVHWEPVEKHFQGTLNAFIIGLQEGLDVDD